LEYYDEVPGTGRKRRARISAGTNDRSLAKSTADELAAVFSKNVRPQVREATLDTLFDIYLREVTPQKGSSKQRHDHRCAALFRRCFGGARKASTLNRRDWDRFIHERRSGALRLPGRVGRHAKAGVRDRTIAYDLRWLHGVLNWATMSGDGRGGVLLERNPLKGLPIPREENPRRPLLSDDQYRALRAIAPEVSDGFELALVLAHDTGHRIGAIRQLRWSDIDFVQKSITWRPENDKIGMEHRAPLASDALAALDRARKRRLAIGDGYVLPSPEDPSKPCSRHLVRDWWQKAELLAGIKRPERLGWHSLRRKFVNDLKADTPVADLAHLGGWKSAMTVITVYQQPDETTMRGALARREERRAAAGT
jgi:integrase